MWTVHALQFAWLVGRIKVAPITSTTAQGPNIVSSTIAGSADKLLVARDSPVDGGRKIAIVLIDLTDQRVCLHLAQSVQDKRLLVTHAFVHLLRSVVATEPAASTTFHLLSARAVHLRESATPQKIQSLFFKRCKTRRTWVRYLSYRCQDDGAVRQLGPLQQCRLLAAGDFSTRVARPRCAGRFRRVRPS